jgi:WD40 repeat protein
VNTTFFLPIAIDVYTPDPQRDPDTNREWFPPLRRVVIDVQSLSELFSSETFRKAGFAVGSRITGAKAEIEVELSVAAENLNKAACSGLVALWSGHGEPLADGKLRLACRGNQSPMRPADGISPTELANSLLSTNAPFVYLILDVCHASAASVDFIETFATFWAASEKQRRGLAVLCASEARDQAFDGALIPILKDLLEKGPSPKARELIDSERSGHWNDQDAWLSAALVNSTVCKELRAANLPDAYHSEVNDVALFPNPLYRPGSPPKYINQARHAFLKADLDSHFLPKSRGLDPNEPGWFFTGRVGITRRILNQLSALGRLVALTGSGGTGKSAILGRLALLSDRNVATQAGWCEGEDVEGTVPPPEWASATLHLRGLKPGQVLSRLREILLGPDTSIPTFDINQLIERFRPKETKPLVILDALDESLEPARISTDVIVPLVRAGWRVLLGTRPSASSRGEADLLSPFPDLGAGYIREDLDPIADTKSDIAAYVIERLQRSQGSPYRGRPRDDPEVEQIAAAVADASGANFLYARITTGSLVHRASPLTLNLGWQKRYLGIGLAGAFAKDLADFDHRFAEHFGRSDPGATALMRALAWGRGTGLPLWDSIWPRVANAVAQDVQPYEREHAEWLLFEAGRYLVEAGESQQAVYRLFHKSLDDYFRKDINIVAVESRIFAELIQLARDNRRPNPYIRRHLAAHAAEAGNLEEIIRDPWLLVLCEPFLRYCDESLDALAPGVMRVYRAVAHRLASVPENNAAQILLGARLYGETTLEGQIRALGLNLPFSPGWCDYTPPVPQSLVFQDYYVASAQRVCWHPTEPLIAVADLRGVRYFHPEDGTPAGARIDLDLENLVDIDWEVVRGEPVLAVSSNGWREKPHVWLIHSDNIPRELVLPTKEDLVGLAWANIRNQHFIAIAARDGVWLKNSESPNQFSEVKRAGLGAPLALCSGTLAGKPALLVLSEKGVWSWDGHKSKEIARAGKSEGSFELNDNHIAILSGSRGEYIVAMYKSWPYIVDWKKALLKPLDNLKWPIRSQGTAFKALAVFEDSSGLPYVALSSWDMGLTCLVDLTTLQMSYLEGDEYAADDYIVRQEIGRVILISASTRIRRWSVSNIKPRPFPIKNLSPNLAFGFDGQRELLARSPGNGTSVETLDPSTGKVLLRSDVSVGVVAFGTRDITPVLMIHEPYNLHVCQASTLDRIQLLEFGTELAQAQKAWQTGIHAQPGSRIGESVFGELGGKTILVSPSNTGLTVHALESNAILYQISDLPFNSLREVAWGVWRGEPIIASGGIHGPISLWRFPSSGEKELVEAILPLEGHRAAIWCLTFGRVQGRVILASAGMENLRIWDLETRQSLLVDIDHPVSSIAFNDSGLLAIGTRRGLITLQLSSSWLDVRGL